jgi:hypothetical protein
LQATDDFRFEAAHMIRRFLSQPTMELFGQSQIDHPMSLPPLRQGKASDGRSKHQANDQSGNGGNGDGHGSTPPSIRPYLQSRSYHGPMSLYWLVHRHNNQISVVIEPGASLIHARMRAALANLDQGEFTEGHELDRKCGPQILWKVLGMVR